jgi:hypothetical protein
MERVLYDRICHIVRHLTTGLELIHKPCIGCSLGVRLRCDQILRQAEEDLAKLKEMSDGKF